ncbi:MAG TPA: hypothetical protein VM737_02645 [Gemmatimonadota bacterium]|nr:hypothetical protein [Gemmatimonadota bacterium]
MDAVRGPEAALVAALLLGLRHATDPDHLTAVSALVLNETQLGARLAGVLGLFWGLGHATTLLALGLPIVLLDRYLPDTFQRAAEVAIGVMIAALAIRLLVRWRRGAFHAHPHAHDGVWHAHPHAHAHRHAIDSDAPRHDHPHDEALGRTPFASFGIGLLHGAGGSAGASLLVVAALPDGRAAAGLAIFAAGTALSMAAASAVFGYALGRRPVAARLAALFPSLGLLCLLFGAWYALDALAFLPGSR